MLQNFANFPSLSYDPNDAVFHDGQDFRLLQKKYWAIGGYFEAYDVEMDHVLENYLFFCLINFERLRLRFLNSCPIAINKKTAFLSSIKKIQ